MADQLQFRGGTTSEVSAASVASREIIIDTQTTQIAVGTSKKKTVMEDSSGNVAIGGGNTSLNADGSASFTGDVSIGSTTNTPLQKLHVSTGSTGGVGVVGIALGSTTASGRSASIIKDTDGPFSLRINASNNSSVNTGDIILGDAFKERAYITSGGNFILGGTLPSSPNIELDAIGTITSASNITSGTFLTSGTTESGARLGASGYVYVQKPAGNGGITHRVYQGNVVTTENRANGDQWTVGDVSVGGTSSVPNIELNADGTATFGSSSSKGGVTITGPQGSGNRASNPLIQLTATGPLAGNSDDTIWITEAKNDGSLRFDSWQGGAWRSPYAVSFSKTGGISANGDVLIGGTLPSAPNIELNADGVGVFNTSVTSSSFIGERTVGGQLVVVGKLNGLVTSSISAAGSATFGGDPVSGANDGVLVDSAGTVRASRPAGSQKLWDGYTTGNSTSTSAIYANGSATFAGDITCSDNSKGLILKSPDGTSFRLSVANDGTLSATSI